MRTRRITRHPKITPEKIRELSELARKIDREEGAEIKARGRAALARHKAIREIISAIKAMRVEKKMSLVDVAERAQIDKANLSRIENMVHENPTIDTILRYADAVGVKVSFSVRSA
ncbi:MAG TPA: helix-turn-helix transcriptional regulator [Tepidisphaeraceae bacterium]|nr:helix-turn-helix transcriptional regulator [Tepidisphaeraceae bacterium]